jgi:diphthamide synthase (EF-2-diphthine--ammonia ligase)
MEAALTAWKARGIRRVAFGDIFLQDLREYRERNLARVEMEAIFPVWLQPTGKLVRDFIGLGFRAVTVCVDPKKLDGSFVGREIDERFVADLPAGVDPCGENGEFHSFVYDGPGFEAPIGFTRGKIVLREGFWFCDLAPTVSARDEATKAVNRTGRA